MRTALFLVLAGAALAAFLLLGGHEPDAPDRTLSRHAADREGAAGDLEVPLPVPGDFSDEAPVDADPLAPVTPPGEGGLEGVVLDARGHPVIGASVEVFQLDLRALRGARASAEARLGSTRSGVDGRFEIEPEREATWYRLTAAHPGHARGTAWAAGRGAWTEIRLAPPSALTVLAMDARERPVPDARVTLDVGRVRLTGDTDPSGRAAFDDLPPGSVLIRVESADGGEGRAGPLAASPDQALETVVWVSAPVRVGGRVLEAETGRPVAGAEVHVARPGRAVEAGLSREDGAFPAVPAGPPGVVVHVAARADGFVPALLPVHLPDTDALHAVDIRLVRSEPWRGRVLDARGQAVEGALVTTTHDGIQGRAPPAVRSDEDGRFELPPPPAPAPGRSVLLTAEGRGGKAAYALRRGQSAPQDLVLRLAHGATVSGRVAQKDGTPVRSVAVRLDPAWRRLEDRRDPGPATARLLAENQRGRGGLQTATDASGAFTIRGVPDGWYRVRLLHGARQTQTPTPFEVSGEGVDVGTLALDEGHELVGEVRRPDGAPLVGAAVVVTVERESDARFLQRAATQADGGFEIQGLPAGRATVRASAAGRADSVTILEIPHADPLRLVLEDGGIVRGVLRDGDRPYPGLFRLHVERADGRRARIAPTTHRARDGRFERTGLPPGSWRVRVEAPGGRAATLPTPLEIGDAGVWEIELDLQQGAALEGRLATSAGLPVAGGRIRIRETETGLGRSVTSGRDGRYRVTGLPAGPYAVTAAGRGGARTDEDYVHLLAGERRTLDLDLLPAGTVEVRVTDKRGRAVPNAVVLARNANGRLVSGEHLIRSDGQGRARLTDLPVGDLDVWARTRGGLEGRTQVTVEANNAATANVVLKKAE